MSYYLGDVIAYSVLTTSRLPNGARHVYCTACREPVAIITTPTSEIDVVMERAGIPFNRYEGLHRITVIECAMNKEYKDVEIRLDAHEERAHPKKKKKQEASA